jgi:hypothetical protein
MRLSWLVLLTVGVLGLGSCVAQAEDPHVTDFRWFPYVGPAVPTMGFPFGVQASYDPWMPGWISGTIFEETGGTERELTTCWYASCVVGVPGDPSDDYAHPRARTFKISLYNEGSEYESQTLVVNQRRLHFGLEGDFDWSPGLFHVTLSQSIGGTDLDTIIRENGREVTSCNVYWDYCTTPVTSGASYSATVEDPEGNVYGISASYRATSSTTGTKETADQIDLPRLGALFPTTSAVCDTLLNFQGSHLDNSTVSDQELACQAGVANRLSMTALLQAVIASGTGTTAVGWWLMHQGTVQVLSPAWPTTPWPDAQVPAIDDLPEVWQGATLGLADHYMLQARGADLTQAAAMAIAATCLWDASGISNDGLDVCRTLPIFVTGSDVAEATDHDVEAIASNLEWFKLNYEASGAKNGTHSWVRSAAPCDGETPSGQQCDEYPFFASEQGGPYTSGPRPHLRYIDASDNTLQGTRYSTFIGYCGLTTGTRPEGRANATGGSTFLVVALPSGLGIPSYTRLCNR